MTPRVALMVQRFLPHLGGLERWADALARALVARGRPVRIVTTEADAAPAGVAIARVPAAAGLMAQARLFADAVAGSGDIVHDTGIGLGADLFQPQMGSRLLNLDRDVAQWPWRRRLRLAVSPGYARLRRDIAALEAAQLATTRRIVAVSREIAEVFHRVHGVPRDRIVLVPNGVDTALFTPEAAAARRAEARAALGLAPGALALLMLAGNFRLKGVQHAIAALARCAAEAPEMMLLVAGAGPIAEFEAIAQRSGVADRVRFLGLRDDVPGLLGAADVFVHPTAHDACSLATIEAMAAGLPVVTTRRNGAADGMTDGREGFVLPGPDATALAGALLALRDPARRAEMGAAARILAERHDFARSVDRLCALHDEIAAERGPCTR